MSSTSNSVFRHPLLIITLLLATLILPSQAEYTEDQEFEFANALVDLGFRDYAKQVGITDIPKFAADMNAPATMAAIQADANEGSETGVSSTPTFLVNGKPILGIQPLDQFLNTVEEAKAAAE